MAARIALLAELPEIVRNLTWDDSELARNCTTAGELFGQLSRSDGVPEISTLDLTRFAITCAPATVSLRTVTPRNIADWNLYLLFNNISPLFDVTSRVDAQCREEFCSAFKWEGNPDVTGIGVSY
ncbi:hypothetical protein B0H63DRAFT_463957 [Podospora didyma]|uniref:Uncharacterized protein n=1 Tax=Podospora didyma TaxID=330526 RepID=A0AAE0U3F0_9PEZI|nr:hypothetical protein B0H63DRAFT_463957 [Podospora didyma]